MGLVGYVPIRLEDDGPVKQLILTHRTKIIWGRRYEDTYQWSSHVMTTKKSELTCRNNWADHRANSSLTYTTTESSIINRSWRNEIDGKQAPSRGWTRTQANDKYSSND